jgi:hypothetical protein
MASLWDTITGADRKNASAEQLKREAARQAAEDAAARKAAAEEAERAAARKRVSEIQFKRGGVVAPKKKPVPMKSVRKPLTTKKRK